MYGVWGTADSVDYFNKIAYNWFVRACALAPDEGSYFYVRKFLWRSKEMARI